MIRNYQKKLQIDPRIFQISVLSGLLIYGIARLDFDVSIVNCILILSTVIITQLIFSDLFRTGRFDPRSPLISGLSLCLLMRSDSVFLVLLCCVITIGSKFVLRWNGKHIFNPTNIGIASLLILSDSVWVSPGQWGNTAFLGFLIACLGGLVVNRAERSDVTYAFMFFYSALLFARAVWLGDPLVIPFHQLQNGALLIFTFFMISDPRTTPDTRKGRILFALVVSSVAYCFQFMLFNTSGLFFALALSSLSVPLIDMVFKGQRFQWNKTQRIKILKTKEVFT